MKDLLPLVDMQSTTGRDLKAANAIKTGPTGSLMSPASSVLAGLSENNVSFEDSLNGLLQAGAIQDGTLTNSALGGNTLPLASHAAELGPSTKIPVSADVETQPDIVLMAGLTPGLQLTVPHDADIPSDAVVYSDMSKLMPQTTSRLLNTPIVDTATQTANRSVVQQPTMVLQAEQTLNKTDVLISAHVPLARMQSGSLDSSQKPSAITRDNAVKASLMSQMNTAEVTDLQPALKADALLNETDRLFTARMQLGTVNQQAELVGYKLATETALNTTQAATTDALHASLVRSPIPQAASAAESLISPGQTSIAETFGKADWGQGMGKQVLWMVNQSISRAEIRLNPANLGPLEVRIEMDNDQVNVVFTSRHAEVREAVEQALPRLREMLEEKGLNLSDTDVSQHSFAEQHNSTFGHADDHNSGLTSRLSMDTEDDQQDADSGRSGMNSVVNYALNESLVDYYI